MLNTRRMAWVFALIAVGLMLPAASWCADKDTKVGVVDLNRVRRDSPRMKQYDEQAVKKQLDLQAELEVRKAFMMLEDAELKELVAIKQKSTAITDAEKARQSALQEKNKSLDTEFASLQQTKSPDANQSARMKALQDIKDKNDTAMKNYVKDANSQWDSYQIDLAGKIENDILQAIKETAENKGFTYVYDRVSLLYGGVDLTDEVIKRLPRKDG